MVSNRGFTIDKEKDKYGAVLIYLTFEMDVDWPDWNNRARERLVDNLNRTHASDTYQGNIDYTVVGTGYDDTGISGEIVLRFPKDYWNDPDWTKEEIIEVGEDAVWETVKYELSSAQRDVIEDLEVHK